MASRQMEHSLQDIISEVKRRTIKIELPRSQSYIRADIAEALAMSETIEALGTVKTSQAADRLTQYVTITVKDVAGRMSSMDSTRLKLRIHWAPHWLPSKAVETVVKRELPGGAVVEGQGVEKSTIKGLGHMVTLVRFAIVRYAGNPADLPNLLKVQAKATRSSLSWTAAWTSTARGGRKCPPSVEISAGLPEQVAIRLNIADLTRTEKDMLILGVITRGINNSKVTLKTHKEKGARKLPPMREFI
ncbi:hypothetical protein CAPTEDRAFT_192947 [Capitella teleta]|uniref:Uncharacterized protein n=1 Tax=Capitella teleta TaxID=283909 RepID=R7UZB3_CAPTE|nr:hypothetical protein CAPTEDRAFT_192947 [Capitella teleta]|eukprot:ELU11918.1 hypothetical protein CAPTEDRAFT_192947 [Capitella teleta]